MVFLEVVTIEGSLEGWVSKSPIAEKTHWDRSEESAQAPVKHADSPGPSPGDPDSTGELRN